MKNIRRILEMDRVVNKQMEFRQNKGLTRVYALAAIITFALAIINETKGNLAVMAIDWILFLMAGIGILLNKRREHILLFRAVLVGIVFLAFAALMILDCSQGMDVIWMLVIMFPLMGVIDFKMGFLCCLGWQLLLFLIQLNPLHFYIAWQSAGGMGAYYPWIYLAAFAGTTFLAAEFKEYYYYYLVNEDALGAKTNIDELTGLHNLQGFYNKIEIIPDGTAIAFSMLSLDGLREINQGQGREDGDRLIVKAAELLKEEFREADFISYMEGTEFSMILENFKEENYSIFIEKIHRINSRMMQESGEQKVMFHAGITFSGKGYEGILFTQAEAAMQKAGEQGQECSVWEGQR